jgi:hypothetical protein
MKTAIIIPYFGKFPEWVNLYFHSCEKNSFIDFYFFTDCEIPKEHATNLHFQQISFADYCRSVSEKLQINFCPKSAYKLCDLKPFYGYIHSDILEKYDFWGFGDVDVIWGDISKFYTEEILREHDVFSTHADRISGHLAIIRNTQKYRELCLKIENWQEKLNNSQNYALDENDFSLSVYPASKYIKKTYAKIIRKIFNWRDAWVIYYRIMPILNFFFAPRKLYFKEQFTTPILGNDGLTYKHDSDTWFYENGKIVNAKNGKEYIYLHFMIFKKNNFRTDHFWNENFYQISINHIFSEKNKIRIDRLGLELE